MSRRLLLSLLALVLLALPATASGNAFSRVEGVYKQEGVVPPCKFSATTLVAALREEDTYAAEYYADFSDAVNAAITAQNEGRCIHPGQSSHAARSGLPAGAGKIGIPPSPKGLPKSVPATTSSGVPAAIVVLGIFGALVVLGCGAVLLGRSRGWDPEWVAYWSHAWSEASFQLGNRWSALGDRLRPRQRRGTH